MAGELIIWATSADEWSDPNANSGSRDVFAHWWFAARTRVGVVVMAANVAKAKEPFMYEHGSGIDTYLRVTKNDSYRAKYERKTKSGSERSQCIDDALRGEGRRGKLSIRAFV